MPKPMHPTRAAVAYAQLTLNNAIQNRDAAIEKALPDYAEIKGTVKEVAAQLKRARARLAQCKATVEAITAEFAEGIAGAEAELATAREARKAHITANPTRRKAPPGLGE